MSGVDDLVVERARARIGMVVRGKYRLDGVLGIGGMATVYAATHRNGHRVALKVLHAELSVIADVQMRFRREGHAANAVKHPGAVVVIDDDIAEDGSAYLVMELLDGQSIEQLWQRHGPKLPPRIVLAIGRELCAVLAAAHRVGIVHRDLKPENLFLTNGGRLKVLDFGLARARDAARPKQTATGMVFGTPAFMPPEQANGYTTQVDAQSDLWSVGATLFTLLSGATVHEGKTAQHFVILAATERARSLTTVLPDADPLLAALVDRALAQDKSRRWASAEAMLAAIREASLALFGDPAPALRDARDLTRVGAFVPAVEIVQSASEATTTQPRAFRPAPSPSGEGADKGDALDGDTIPGQPGILGLDDPEVERTTVNASAKVNLTDSATTTRRRVAVEPPPAEDASHSIIPDVGGAAHASSSTLGSERWRSLLKLLEPPSDDWSEDAEAMTLQRRPPDRRAKHPPGLARAGSSRAPDVVGRASVVRLANEPERPSSPRSDPSIPATPRAAMTWPAQRVRSVRGGVVPAARLVANVMSAALERYPRLIVALGTAAIVVALGAVAVTMHVGGSRATTREPADENAKGPVEHSAVATATLALPSPTALSGMTSDVADGSTHPAAQDSSMAPGDHGVARARVAASTSPASPRLPTNPTSDVPPAPARRPSASCTPPYDVDGTGKKIWKLECL